MTHVKKLSVILEITLVNITRKGFDASSTFRQTNSNEIIKIIKTLNINKACQYTDFPTKIIIKFNDNLEISIIVLKNVNLLVCLNMPTLYLYIRKKKKLKQIIDR